MDSKPRRVELMDTTLRDGEQTQGVAMAPEEKLTLAKRLLSDVCVDRIEVVSARVSDGEQRAAAAITAWADKSGMLNRVEALGFCDRKRSADWLGEAGCRTMNLLAKGSERHLVGQLRKTRQQHLDDITATLEYCRDNGMQCNCYPEDWSQGMLEDSDYCRWLVARLAELPFQRVLLPDTLGILCPEQVRSFVGELVEAHPETHFDFHGHNDYGLATANCLAAVRAGARGVHVTVNGLGERAGNTALDEAAVALRDFAGVEVNVNEQALQDISQMVEVFSGRRISPNKPVAGEAVFVQTAGIHADGDRKGGLYVTRLNAERFGRTRTYALGKLSGKASLEQNLDVLGIQLSEEHKRRVLERVIQLGDQKRMVTEDDLPFLIADVLQTPSERTFAIEDCVVTSTMGMLPTATVKIRFRDQSRQYSATGDGGYDAVMKAVGQALDEFGVTMPQLLDYEVHIPPGGRTDALVQTTITWAGGIKTRGVHSDQLLAAVKATETMLNLQVEPPENGMAFTGIRMPKP